MIDTNSVAINDGDKQKFLCALLLFQENPDFFSRMVFPYQNMYRAYRHNRIYKKRIGGSGIAQQLARIIYLNQEKTYTRKLKEATIAFALVMRYGYKKVLDKYIELADLGLPQKGFEAAARFYYHKPLSELDIYETITLIAILPNPPKNRPDLWPEDALAARNRLIFRLYKHQVINFDEVCQVTVYQKKWSKQTEQGIRAKMVDVFEQACREHKSYNDILTLQKTELKVIDKRIEYSAKRLALVREYSKLHYGKEQERILPQTVVVHWTGASDFKSTYGYFYPAERSTLKHGTLNVSTHFVVDRDGKIYQLLPKYAFARHTIGFNWCAIGIENVGGVNGQEDLTAAQVQSNIALIKQLRAEYSKIKYVFGHYQQKQAQAETGLYRELIDGYHSLKIDPGQKFMRALKEELDGFGLIVLADE